ncbi:MAG: PepSY-like domain-containing protein [Bacteroidetes bacterium]|nr:PepSY-like domain-containing protein [Bacteroidota bacterium]
MRKIIFAYPERTYEFQTIYTYNEQSIEVSSLPAIITQYIDNYYPDASISEALVITSREPNYLITLNTYEELVFNKTGSYLGNVIVFQNEHHFPGVNHVNEDAGGHSGQGHHGNGISINSLSTDILNYISTNYSGYSALHAEMDTMCQFGNITEVMIGISGSNPVKLVFDTTNIFVLKAERITVSNIPQAVIDAITNIYTAYNIKPIAEKFTLADSSIGYNIYINQLLIRKQITIKSDATIVCEK